MERWERRERKLRRRRTAMKASGIGLKKIVLPLIARKAAEAKRATDTKGRPLRWPRPLQEPARSVTRGGPA